MLSLANILILSPKLLTSVHSAMRFTGWGVKNALLAGVFRRRGG